VHAAIARCAPSAVKVPAKKYMGNSATAKDECEPAKVLKFYRQKFYQHPPRPLQARRADSFVRMRNFSSWISLAAMLTPAVA